MRRIKQRAGLALAVGGLLAGSVAVSVPAEAASPAVASPAEACGNNYHEIDHHDLGSIATVHLLYNGTTNCVVTTKKVDRGKPTHVLAAIAKVRPDGSYGYIDDHGKRAYYAGPVRVDAARTCISWGGAADPGWIMWYSEPSHCK
ncbi:hypothetical protein FHX46_002009 [Amycolatopsis viridis]|uniref:Spore-associated protein A n=2 Tax=Amycolatopsis viridis TaxID=185678 RepID=A0ABX0SSL9_9PSEU|nr:hypothetical protein [Amycolatopsis viridis]